MYFIKTIGNYNVFITDIPIFIYAHKMIAIDDIKFDMSGNVKDVLNRLEIKHINDVTEYDKKQDVYYLRKGETIINLTRKYVLGSARVFIDGIENFGFTETSELSITLTDPITEFRSIILIQYTDPTPGSMPSTDSFWKNPVATYNDISTTYTTPQDGWIVMVNDTNKLYRYDLATLGWKEYITSGTTNIAISWKEPVATYNDISTTYPLPEEGWMVTVNDTNKMYRYDIDTSSWKEFISSSGTATQSYLKTIQITVTNNQTTINTGIRNDNTGTYKTNTSEIAFFVNSLIQQYGIGKDYTTQFVSNELVVTWLNRDFILESTDEVSIIYTHVE